MSDHSNINHPDDEENRDHNRKEVSYLKADVERLEAMVRHLRSDLDAIFTRVGRGDTVDLYCQDGTHIEICATSVNGSDET